MPTTDPRSSRSRYLVMDEDRKRPGYFTERPAGSHDFLVILTLRGRGLVMHGEGSFPVAANDVVLLRPGRFHRYQIHPGATLWHRLWAHFVPPAEWSVYLDWPQVAPGFHRLTLHDPAVRRQVVARMREADHLLRGYDLHREALSLNGLEAALIWCNRCNPEADRARLDPRVREALDYLSRRLDQPVSVESLAEHCGLSASRLAHLFRDQVGQTPQRFLEQQRMARAKQLLEVTGRTIGEIAGDVGFDNPFYFSLRFKRATGESPRAYRRRFES